MTRQEFDELKAGDVIYAETTSELKRIGYHDCRCVVLGRTNLFIFTTKNDELDRGGDRYFSLLTYEMLKDTQGNIYQWKVDKPIP